MAEARSVEALPDQVGEDVRNVLPKIAAEEQADSLDEEEVACYGNCRSDREG